MTTATTNTIDLKSMRTKAAELRAAQTARPSMKEGKAQVKATEQEQAKSLLESIKNLANTPVVVGEGDSAETMTLEEALISGKATTIKVGDKDRAHTMFMDAGRQTSLTKLVTRFAKICANVEIRPKSLDKSEEKTEA